MDITSGRVTSGITGNHQLTASTELVKIAHTSNEQFDHVDGSFTLFSLSERAQRSSVWSFMDMDLLAALALRVLHFIYALISLIHSFWCRQTRPSPQSLQSPRQRLPKNLALTFVGDANIPPDVVEQTILQSCMNIVEWCRTLGIPKLTIYEEHGASPCGS